MVTTAIVAHRDTLTLHSLWGVIDAGDVAVRATCRTAAGLVAACRAHHPDVVVAAVELDDGPLHDHIAAVLRTPVRVVLVCDEPTDDGVREALLAGASGCLPLGHADGAQIRDAVRAVATGQAALHPTIAACVLRHWRSAQADPAREAPVTLTARETQVLHMICDGLTTASAARRLGIAAKTVEAHKARVFAKLGVRNQAEAVATASRRGLLAAR